jgi:hypothetical protein
MYNTMSNSSQNFSSSQKIPHEATQQKKLTKIAARYIELEQFKDSDHHKGYFCYNCTYFVKPHHCAVVTDEGMDILGRSSGVIAPHGLCSLWMPNEAEIHGSSVARSDKSDEPTPGVSASFSCDFCNKSFNSREELRQHSTQEHSR